MRQVSGPAPTSLLERLGVLLVLVAALVPRARDFAAPFDRELEGWQGSFFTIAAINYERMGLGVAGGYPVVSIDTMQPVDGTHMRIPPEQWLVYANHPPVVPLVTWLSLAVLGPTGWDSAWVEDRAPADVEPVVRLPFLLFHLAFLWALWWAVRQARGAGTAMVALAIAAFTPVLVIYGTLVNYENAALPALMFAAGYHVRWTRRGQRGDLVRFALWLGVGGAVTWAPLLFLPAFALAAIGTGRPAPGAWELLAGGLAALVVVVAHTLGASSALAALGQAAGSPADRMLELVGPMFDGTLPFADWLARQGPRVMEWFTLPLLAAALVGIAVLARAASRPQATRDDDRRPLDIGFPLLLGGVCVLLGFYRHTFEPQYSFLMWLAPGIAVLAATAIEAAARPLARLRAGIAPVVVLTGTLGLFATQRFNELRHPRRARTADESALPLPALELPLPDATGRELASLLPQGSLGLYPSDVGLNLASSFYAWRSLWPITGPEDGAWRKVAARFGLGDAPVVLLLPTRPPESARAQVEALRALATAGWSESADGSWTATVLRDPTTR